MRVGHQRAAVILALVLVAPALSCRRTVPDDAEAPPQQLTRAQRISLLGLDPAKLRAQECFGEQPEVVGHVSPLFHDCQEAVGGPSDDHYVTLIGAAIDADLRDIDDAFLQALGPTQLVRVGSISNKGDSAYAFSSTYTMPKNSIHCLYVGFQGSWTAQNWRAAIIPCSTPNDPTARIITWNTLSDPRKIHVNREVSPGAGTQYPIAASLDWDAQHRRQVMGVRCGTGWCLIGGNGKPTLPSLPNASHAANRSVRGWHDRQVLAIEKTGGGLRPTRVTATLMAEPELEVLVREDFTAVPRLVARVHLGDTINAYRDKFGFDIGTTGSDENSVSIGVEVGADGEENWFAEIRPASGAASRTFKVNRSDQNELDPPGSARWGWLKNDENMWVRCGGACCQITDTPYSPGAAGQVPASR
jgi:hypothetical protein